MNPALETRRRVIFKAFDTYVIADRDFRAAATDAARFFPGEPTHGVWHVGDPGSRIRRLYETRDHALQRLLVARMKLPTAKGRLDGTAP